MSEQELLDPEKMTDAQLYEHIEQTCTKYPCEKGCTVIDETLDTCGYYSVPQIWLDVDPRRIGRLCQCEKPLAKGKQYCEDCRVKNRQTTWRKKKQKQRGRFWG